MLAKVRDHEFPTTVSLSGIHHIPNIIYPPSNARFDLLLLYTANRFFQGYGL